MKNRIAILAFLLVPALAMAQQLTVRTEPSAENDPRQAQIQAATTNGIASLRDQVLRAKLARDTTVADFLNRTKSTDDLNAVLSSAQPVGGPRWVDDCVCQVRVELPSPKISAFLLSVAKDETKNGGIRPDVLKTKLAEWKDLKFTGVGSSAGGEEIEQARPHDLSGRWSQVSDLSRRKAIGEAKSDALQQVVKSLGPMMLDGKKPVSNALTQPVIAQRLSGWLTRQPVTKIEFLDDLKVSVTVSVAPKSLATALKSAVLADASFSRGLSVDWSKVSTQVEKVPVSFAGTATASLEAPSTTLPVVVLPLTPQEGIDQQLDAEGTANAGSSRLKVGLAAQADATGKIREKFLLLHLDSKTTLGDAARKDPALSQAIDRAIKRAGTSKVNYNTDGSVQVRISLDVRDAWDELRSNP